MCKSALAEVQHAWFVAWVHASVRASSDAAFDRGEYPVECFRYGLWWSRLRDLLPMEWCQYGDEWWVEQPRVPSEPFECDAEYFYYTSLGKTVPVLLHKVVPECTTSTTS